MANGRVIGSVEPEAEVFAVVVVGLAANGGGGGGGITVVLDDGAAGVDVGSSTPETGEDPRVLDDMAVNSEVEDSIVLDILADEVDVKISVAERCGTSVLDKASVEPLDERLTGKGIVVMIVTNGRKSGVVAVAFAKGGEELKMLDKEADCPMRRDALLLDSGMVCD